MPHPLFPSALLAAAITLSAPLLAEPSSAQAFSITPQPLASALAAFSQATGWQLGIPTELAKGIDSPGVYGLFAPEQALARLLSNTGLGYRVIDNGSVVLEPTPAVELAPVTISATRRPQAVTRVPGSVSVIERNALDQALVTDIQALTRYEPGVSVGGTGQRSGITGYNIRGVDGARVLTQVDGVAVPESYFFGPYAQTQRNYVDPEVVKRVEILRGPNSSLYGSSAIGGAVSYYTLDPSDIIQPGRASGARLKAGYSGKDNSRLTSGTLAGQEGDFDALLHVSQRSGHETQSFGENRGTGLARTAANPQDARSTSLLAKTGWNYNDDARLALTYERYESRTEEDIKSAYGGPFIRGKGRGMYRWRLSDDLITRERFSLSHTTALSSLFADQASWSLNYQRAKTDQRTTERYEPFTRNVLRHRQTIYEDRQWFFDGQLEKAFTLGAFDHELTYGASLKRQQVTGLRSGHGTCLAAGVKCTPGQSSPEDYLPPQSDFPDPTVGTYSLFAQDEIPLGNWTFLPGARYDYTRLQPHLTDEFLRAVGSPGQVSDAAKTWHRLSPKLGVTYALSEQTSWYGQYAEGFRTPTAKALYGRFESVGGGYTVEPNPNLEPEKSRSLETGLRGYFDTGSYELALFYNSYRDFIDESALKPGYSETTFSSSNIKRASIHGAEAKGRLNLSAWGAPEGLYTQGSLAYAYGRNRDTGAPLNSVNPLTAVIGLGYDQPRYGGQASWTLATRKTRVDESALNTPDGGALFRTPGFGVLDLTGYYKLTDDLTFNAGLYNLTNQKYWRWDNVRGYDSVGEAAVTAPANLDRLTEPGRYLSFNLVWDI
jgi:hemoglobin/transferrin/lactoferrin receptor protein